MARTVEFRHFLDELDVYYEEFDFEGGTVFRFQQQITDGPNLALGAIFNVDETLVDLQINNIFNVTDPLKEKTYLQLLNQLNKDYRYLKLVLDESQFVAKHSIVLEGTYNYSKVIFDSLLMLVRAVEECLPDIEAI